MIEKHLALSPDVVVVTIYGGNDLTDVLMLGHIFSETKSRGLTPESAAKREEALAISHHILGQGYGSLLFFKDRPSELEFALTTTARVLEQISILCEDAGAELLLLYLPSPLAFPREQPANGELEIRALFELTPMDLALPSAFSQGLLSAARELQVPAFDLTSTLADCDACFWRTDLHLSVRGHRRVGERLSGLIQGLPRAAERLQG